MDGIDLALICSDGEEVAAHGPSRTVPFDEDLRSGLRALIAEPVDGPGATGIERQLTLAHAQAVRAFLSDGRLPRSDVAVVGFHGQTVLHQPERGRTWQIGDGALLARELGLPVVNEFRAADVAAGGEGAPLAPLYHAALAAALVRPLAVLNIGGVANVTWLGGDGSVLAFDTGPGNALLDDWVGRHCGTGFDAEGALAREGEVDEAILGALLDHPYFDRPPPKSLDRNAFLPRLVTGASAANGAAILAEFTARAVRRALAHMPEAPRRWLVCGGGRHNAFLMERLGALLPGEVAPVETVGWRGDALEAEAFAFLALRSLRGLPLSLPRTTGVPRPLTGGRLHRP